MNLKMVFLVGVLVIVSIKAVAFFSYRQSAVYQVEQGTIFCIGELDFDNRYWAGEERSKLDKELMDCIWVTMPQDYKDNTTEEKFKKTYTLTYTPGPQQ